MTMRSAGRRRVVLWVITTCVAAVVALVALSVQRPDELSADVLLQGGLSRNGASLEMLDQVTKMVGYAPSGISYGEGQMPLGLGAASGICDHGYCPQEGEGVEINPREVPTSKYAVRWDGFNWDTMDDDVNIFQPTDCLAKHLAGDENACCEHDTEPCDKWGHGLHPHSEMKPYPIPPPVPKTKAKPRKPRGKAIPAPGWSSHPYNVPYIRETFGPPEPRPADEDEVEDEDFSHESYPGEWEGDGGIGEEGTDAKGEAGHEGGKMVAGDPYDTAVSEQGTGSTGGMEETQGGDAPSDTGSEGGEAPEAFEGGEHEYVHGIKGGGEGGGDGHSYSYTWSDGGEAPEGYQFEGGRSTLASSHGEALASSHKEALASSHKEALASSHKEAGVDGASSNPGDAWEDYEFAQPGKAEDEASWSSQLDVAEQALQGQADQVKRATMQ